MFFFIDESGHDGKKAPYMVLAATAIHEKDLWKCVQTIYQLQINHFGCELSKYKAELKGNALLSSKRFRLAQQQVVIKEEYANLVVSLLIKPENPTAEKLTAFGRASLKFVDDLIETAIQYDLRLFASVIDLNALMDRKVRTDYLRKDYVFLFERFYYYLNEDPNRGQGIIVFDEIEKAQARLLLDQVGNYFIKTEKGKERSSRVIPSPFFVHSDLTAMIQISDIFAYIINWGYRSSKITKPTRTEIVPYAKKLSRIIYRSKEKIGVSGIKFIDDLGEKC